MAAQQVSAGLSAPRIFQQKSVKTIKTPQSYGPLHRSLSRTHNFAYNPALDSSEVTAPQKFVRPDCPPDASEPAQNNMSSVEAGGRLAAKQVRNTARSALEQVSQLGISEVLPALCCPAVFAAHICHVEHVLHFCRLASSPTISCRKRSAVMGSLAFLDYKFASWSQG